MSNKFFYVFPAIFNFAEDGISIFFPDLPGCLPCADTTEEAIKNAKEALGLHLYGMEKDNEKIPEPSRPLDVHLKKGQTLVLIDINMNFIKDRISNEYMKKTLTIPRWLNKSAEEAGINFSQTLQEALKQQLNL